VSVERTVHRDGINEYRLNGSIVRLKDIQELLAGANIGESGHHIISQGEADKILSASPKDRREMLEDALGLKVYQYKREESLRKLDKTEENMRQVDALRREIAPHLRFLKRQVEKIEKAEEMRSGAVLRYQVYFKREDEYITAQRNRIDAGVAERTQELAEVHARVEDARRVLASASEDKRAQGIVERSHELDQVRRERGEATRTSARLQGQLQALERVTERASVPAVDIAHLADEGESELSRLQSVSLDEALRYVRVFIERLRALTQVQRTGDDDVTEIRASLERANEAEKVLSDREAQLTAELDAIRTELESSRIEEREKERLLFELTSTEREIRHRLESLRGERERLRLVEQEFERELSEVAPLIGRDVLQYLSVHVPTNVPREEQEREKRELEKIKIRLEEMGMAGSGDVMKEYQDASEREAHLEKEVTDLTQSAIELKGLIVELQSELSKRFDEGLTAINTEFSHFFGLLFDGGSAALTRVKEAAKSGALEDVDLPDVPEEGAPQTVEGIEISLNIPRKRIRSLVMLSGGERALTSIALIFAMSSVNPPPFLVLDETDAALDEANSKRYGDMIAALAQKSQLAVITHNRETMGRAGILYGVTMGGDGVSKVLSVKLEEAVTVAK
jgi:chromosome segregation protein